MNNNQELLQLCKLLKYKYYNVYNSSIKLQTFLFLYEFINHIEESNYIFKFLNIWKNYNYNRKVFDNKIDSIDEDSITIDKEKIEITYFIVSSHTENELSELTHSYNFWSEKAKYIKDKYNDLMLEEDFSEEDKNHIKTMYEVYNIDYVREHKILPINNKRFILNNNDYKLLIEKQKEVLNILSNEDELINPVYISISDRGEILFE